MTYDHSIMRPMFWKTTALTDDDRVHIVPSVDFVIFELDHLGLLDILVQDTQPLLNQDTTVWFDPANPSYSNEGVTKLWDGTQYQVACPALFARLWQKVGNYPTSMNYSGIGIPATSLGVDGDFYHRTDSPGGIYVKVLGVWTGPLPGSIEIQATETALGYLELATQAETDAGLDDLRAITPLKLANYQFITQATEVKRGTAELATQAETNTGTDDLRIITPLKLANYTFITQATEAKRGTAELATQAETDAGTDDLRIITPLKLANWSGNIAKATQAEANAGTNDAKFITPLKLANYTFITQATEAKRGTAEVATTAEVTAGTDDTTFITPLKLAAAIGGGGGISILAHGTVGGTVTGATAVNAGANAIVTFSTPAANANYSVATSFPVGGDGTGVLTPTSKTTTGFNISLFGGGIAVSLTGVNFIVAL